MPINVVTARVNLAYHQSESTCAYSEHKDTRQAPHIGLEEIYLILCTTDYAQATRKPGPERYDSYKGIGEVWAIAVM